MNLTIDKTKLNKICETKGISYLGLFGSYAREEEQEESDVDLLVEYDSRSPIKTLFDHMDVEEEFKKLLNKNVDLVTKRSLHPYINTYVYKDLKTLYEK